MESEKVKEIKYYLEQSACIYGNMQKQALTLINELEIENERLKEYRKNYSKTVARIRSDNTELKDRIAELESELEKEQINNLNCDTELQYKEKRIVELEKENARLLNSVETVQNNRCTTKCELTEKQLKQFAERLIEKMGHYDNGWHIERNIDETLKEFINTNKGDNKQ